VPGSPRSEAATGPDYRHRPKTKSHKSSSVDRLHRRARSRHTSGQRGERRPVSVVVAADDIDDHPTRQPLLEINSQSRCSCRYRRHTQRVDLASPPSSGPARGAGRRRRIARHIPQADRLVASRLVRPPLGGWANQHADRGPVLPQPQTRPASGAWRRSAAASSEAIGSSTPE